MTRRTDILSADDMKRIREKAATNWRAGERGAPAQPVEDLVPAPRPEETRSPVSAR